MMQRPIVIFLLIGPWSYAQSQLSYAQDSASYPIVDPATQKARDNERRHILESELQIERQELAKAQASLTSGRTQERAADVHRRLENIKSLQRELGGVAQRPQAPRQRLRVVVKAQGPAASPRSTNGTAAFWNPYNRAPDPEVTADLSTSSRRESP
ncbi:MAG TPA: hypothetical protein VGD52_20015 [Pseudoduganella sp.]